MANPYYNHGSFPATGSAGASASMRAELDSITAGFNKLPTLTANNVVFVNASGTALEARAGIDAVVIGGTTPAAGTFTTLSASTLALTSGFSIPLGSAAAPSLSINGDSNTGLYSGGADSLSLTAGGVQRAGINTTGFFVTSAAGADASLSLQALSYARDWRLKVSTSDGFFRIRDNTGSLDVLTLDILGRVGIGRDPLAPLHIKSASLSQVIIETSTVRGSGQVALQFNDPTGTKGYVGYGSANDNLHVYQGLGADLLFYTNALERARIDSGGNLGIGMTALGDSAGYGGKTIEVSGPVYARQSTDPNKYLSIGASAGIAYLEANGTAMQLAILTASAERVRIDASGRIGVGTTPQSWGANRVVLELGGASDQSYVAGRNTVNVLSNLYFDGTNFRTIASAVGGLYQVGAATHNWFSASNGGAGGISTLTQTMWLDSSGSLGVGVSPTSILDISRSGASLQARVRAATGFAAILQLAGNNNTAGTTSFDLQQDNAGNADIVQRNNARLSLYANATEWVRINTGGDISLQLGAGALRLNGHISRFESGEQSVPTTTFASNTLTHGGSRVPDVCRLVLRCKTAELGYSVGDEVDVTLHNHTMTDRAFNVWHSTTQTGYVWITGLNVAPSISHKTTGTMTTVTAANWRVVVYNHWL